MMADVSQQMQEGSPTGGCWRWPTDPERWGGKALKEEEEESMLRSSDKNKG